MDANKRIEIEHLTRVEGHGNITAVVEDGHLREARFDIVETPRLFEVFLRGRDYPQVTHMASRICGICAVSHRLAAVKAVEEAFGTQVGERIRLLRRLAFHGEVVASHALHLFFLVAPDMFGVPSVFHLLPERKETVLRAMRIKRAALGICTVVAGRHIHPVGMEAGGFSFDPPAGDLSRLKGAVETAAEDLRAMLPLFRGHAWPEFHRETDYVSLRHPEVYAFTEGELHSSRHGASAVRDYRRVIREHVVPGSTAKHALFDGAPFMVGALARFNNNHAQLGDAALRAAAEIGLSAPCANPFMIPAAQLVEAVHCLDESIGLIDRLLAPEAARQPCRVEVRPAAGRGVGAVEAPRGTLFHEYRFDGRGVATDANLVIPTAQNLANLHEDMRACVPQVADLPEGELAHRLEILVRAYDPCISCSTHAVRLGG